VQHADVLGVEAREAADGVHPGIKLRHGGGSLRLAWMPLSANLYDLVN
jgi:hypothetical protein